MMGLARLKSPVAVAAALFLATTGGAVAFQVSQTSEPSRVRSQSPPPRATDVVTVAIAVPDPAVNRALARQQLALIDEILTAQRELVRSARMELTDASFALLGRQRLEMLRKAGAEKAEIVAALEKYISSLTEDEAIAKALVESARAHHIAILDVQYRRREAEMWLNEEKAR